MKRIEVKLLDDTGELVSHWFSTPTPYILELMADLGVDFNAGRAVNVDATLDLTDADIKKVDDKDVRAALRAEKKRLEAMTPAELDVERAEYQRAKGNRVRASHAMLAAFLTMEEPEGVDGLPGKVWSRKQAAEIIPWETYTDVIDTVRLLVDDAMSKKRAVKNVPEQAPTE